MILLASRSIDALSRWKRGVLDIGPVLMVTDLKSVTKCDEWRIKPEILLLDIELPDLNGLHGVLQLRKSRPMTRIIVLGRDEVMPDDMELALFRAGVRGCCRGDIEPKVLKRITEAVQRGELWIRRALIPRLLDDSAEISDTQGKPMHLNPGGFTLRQTEIATLVGSGKSNKQIARQLAIAESTVKAHLTDIFRKIGVDDRLQLALRMQDIKSMESTRLEPSR